MKQEPEVPFSRLWDLVAKWLHLESGTGTPQPQNVRPLKPRTSRRLRRGLIIAGIFFFLFILLPWLIYLYTEWLWYGEVGFTQVFWKMLLSKMLVGAATAAFFFAVIYGNIIIARKMAPRYQFGPGTEVIERVPVSNKTLNRIIPLALLLPSLIAFAAGAAAWEEVLRFLGRTDFGVADPVFGYDAGFYIFTLPVLQMLQSLVWWTLVLSVITTAGVHFLDYAISWKDNRIAFAPHVKGHLSVLMGLIMFTLAWSYLLKGYILLFSPRGVVFGASYTDVHAQLPVFKFLAASAVVAGVLFLINIHFRGWKLPAAAIAIIVVTAVVGGRIYPFIVQQYQVSPNELAKEEQYIKYSIDFTRQAFDLNTIEDRQFAANDALTGTDLQANMNTVSNVRLWSPATLQQTFGQIQTIRPYYKFLDVDVDRYMFGGRLQQVMLSPREFNLDDLDPRARTWQNEHLVYTHGYGVVISPVAQVSAEGLPQMVMKDIPPQSSVPELAVTQPAIYFGERANDYIVVGGENQEFDYPKGDENVYTAYSGRAGIDIGSFLKKAAFSWRFASLKLLVSSSVGTDSRILIHRNIRDRIENIAPFLRYDKDPYSVLVDGRLLWVQDAYTTTTNYPYSQPSADGFNYIRNSVKVVADAYDGTVTFYVVDGSDPLVRMWQNVFPDLFTPGDRMPENLRAHLRYPEDIFRTQADMYTTYHMTDPKVFYNKEDQWNMPRQQAGNTTAPMDPYYVIMSLPGDPREEFMLMLPFTPGSRENMVAWMAAKSDPGNYGKRVVFKFPKDKLVFGPTQVQSRFNQDPTISAQITLWGQAGSQVIFGNLLVIPVNESILYVQPLYLRAERSQIPEMKRVLVSFAGKVAMEEDLSKALENVFQTKLTGAPEKPGSGSVPTGTTPTATTPATTVPSGGAPASLKELAAAAMDHYNKAVEAQRQGDWAAYGNELRALQDVLNQMQAAAQ